jgi:hypothetical protein
MDILNTQECYIDDKKYLINEFIGNEILLQKYKNGEIKIYDKLKNELIFADGPKISPYFRRSNCGDNPMTDWHKKWQSHFDGYTEKKYQCKEMIKKYRRTDVDLNDKQNIEFQYSPINKDNVNERKHDYGLMKKNVLWVIYGGNDNIEITELKHSNRVFLEFKSEYWKYKSFIDYDYIYIDIHDKIYKICPKFVKSHMIDIQNPISKEQFCKALKNEVNPFNDVDIYQTNIFVRQQGAGNGKTYGIIQLIQDSSFLHYDIFVYLTKQHSAVHVIYNEIKDQQQKGILNDIKFENLDDSKPKYFNKKTNKWEEKKQHCIYYTNKTNGKEYKIIIGTFDSFVYALGDKDSKGVDKYISMVNSIINDELKYKENVKSDGGLSYAGGVKLNKKMLLIGDEMQDLHELYIKAILKVSRDRYVDFYAVGDILQSISIEHNSFAFLVNNDLPTDTMNIKRYDKTNYCRRFSNEKLINFVNNVIPFNKYNLPIIQVPTDINQDICDNSLIIIHGQTIYSTDTDNSKINSEVKKIMEYYKYEVETNNMTPKDFLIVTPFVNKNPLVEALHISIREYWKNKENTNNKSKYTKYSVFHKSDEGTSVDLSESDDSTRIVSIHSSKGDGRSIVFVIGLSESGLKRYSGDTDNLIYNSLLHVALTRMKKKLYFRIEANSDDIHLRYEKYSEQTGDIHNIPPDLHISKNISIREICNNNKMRENNFNICYENIIKLSQYKTYSDNDNNKKIIDLKHHCVRYSIFNILFLIEIMNDKLNNDPEYKLQQLYQIWKNCINYELIKCDTTIEYNRRLWSKDETDKFPILIYKKEEGEYSENCDELLNYIDIVKKKLNKTLKKKESLNLDSIESVCLFYMMQICEQKKKSMLPITDMYDIINIYKKSKSNEKDDYLMSHYEKITHIKKLYDDLKNKYPNLKWLIDHDPYMNGFTTNFSIHDKINLIAYNDNNIIICYIKPQFNSINYNEVLLDSIFDTYLIHNIEIKDDKGDFTNNHVRFNGKQITSCVFTFDEDTPFYIDWKNKDGKNLILENKDLLTNMIGENLGVIFKMKNQNIFKFYKYWKNQFGDKKPNDIITCINDKFHTEKELTKCKFPPYIEEFLNNIKSQIQTEKKKGSKSKIQQQILDKYEDEIYFIDELNYYMKESIERYLGIYKDNNSESESDLSSESSDSNKEEYIWNIDALQKMKKYKNNDEKLKKIIKKYGIPINKFNEKIKIMRSDNSEDKICTK